MRLAVVSDVHGNPIALDAVLADVEQLGVDGFIVLGDLAAIGYDPVHAVVKQRDLPNATWIRGNTDRYVTRAEYAAHVSSASPFEWTAARLRDGGVFEFVDGLPLEARLVLPDGTRVLAVHASPGTDDGKGIQPCMSDDEVREALRDCASDLVFVGHTHWPIDRTVDGVRVVNPGSVSNPFGSDTRAKYVLVVADRSGTRLEPRRVAYDHEAVIAAIEAGGYPDKKYLIKFQRAEQTPPFAVPG